MLCCFTIMFMKNDFKIKVKVEKVVYEKQEFDLI